ncbi:hypothetical protein [Parapedobacter pyrenivorans]|uniref:hypothetical protein n=1 Tax=Parapedobacter pyrenivorans TaxID=1305674 RepID=UPI00166C5E08|nr:hypothetical protein [Parapedobacter pyrenivorans]
MKSILRIGEGYALSKHKLKHTYILFIRLLAVVTIMCLEARAQPERSEVSTSVGNLAHRSTALSGVFSESINSPISSTFSSHKNQNHVCI